MKKKTDQIDLEGERIPEPSRPVRVVASGIKVFDLFGFFIANLILFYIFQKFLPGNNTFQYFVFFLVSLIIIKTDFIFELVDILTNISKIPWREKWHQFKNQSGNRILTKKLFVYCVFITVKQLFFNILYYLFPILLIWVALAGVFGLTGIISYDTSKSPYQTFAVLSIILGLFQYFLKRHEEKILLQIDLFSKRISQIINEEGSFEAFYLNIGNTSEENKLKNSITRCIDPKLLAADFFSTILQDSDVRRYFMRRKAPIPIQLHTSYTESYKKFEVLDIAANSEQISKKSLLMAYENFFNESLENKIINRIESEIDIQAFGRLAFSNINIIYEVLPEFIKEGTNSFFNEVFQKRSDNKKKSNSQDYRSSLMKNVMRKIFLKIIS